MEKVRCKLKHCLHESRELNKDEAIRVGAGYYHPDCYKAHQQIKEIVDIFSKQVNPNVVYSQLMRVINTIVYERGNSSEFLLYGLKYYLTHKIPLNHPQGLYYVVQNADMARAYKKSKELQIAKEVKESISINEESDNSFVHVPTKTSGFADILK